MKKALWIGVVIFAVSVLVSGCVAVKKEEKTIGNNPVKTITAEEYQQLLGGNEKAVILVSRSSCQYCAITEYLISQVNDGRLPVYIYNLEPYWGTDRYEELKSQMGMAFVPDLIYIEEGAIKYKTNSPLDEGYFDEGVDYEKRNSIRESTVKKMNDFIDGCIGKGPVIDEEFTEDTVIEVE